MNEQNLGPGVESRNRWDHLEDFVHGHIPQFIQRLLVEEVTMRLGRAKSERLVAVDAPEGYRNGYGNPRKLTLTGGSITVQRPRVRNLAERFVSRLLPLFQRRTKQVGSCSPVVSARIGARRFRAGVAGAVGCWGTVVVRRTPAAKGAVGGREYATWKQQRLDTLEVVSVWADGLYVKASLEHSKAALLVLIGALTDGRKVVLAVESGQRESKEPWGVVLRDLRTRGLKPWRCTIADGQLGIWAALAEQQPTAAEQRCWNHRLVNVLDAIPKAHQAEASMWVKTLPYAETQAACERLRDQFSRRYRARAPKAVERVHHDWERLVTVYQFPKEHWRHLRTTNVVESSFALVRLRTMAGQRFKRVESATALIWKLLQVAEQTFQRLNAPKLLPAVYAGTRSVDGEKQTQIAHEEVAA